MGVKSSVFMLTFPEKCFLPGWSKWTNIKDVNNGRTTKIKSKFEVSDPFLIEASLSSQDKGSRGRGRSLLLRQNAELFAGVWNRIAEGIFALAR